MSARQASQRARAGRSGGNVNTGAGAKPCGWHKRTPASQEEGRRDKQALRKRDILSTIAWGKFLSQARTASMSRECWRREKETKATLPFRWGDGSGRPCPPRGCRGRGRPRPSQRSSKQKHRREDSSECVRACEVKWHRNTHVASCDKRYARQEPDYCTTHSTPRGAGIFPPQT